MRLGVDLGGTKIEILALDEKGNELLRKRVSTPRDDYQATVDSVKNLIVEVETELKQQGTIGIGTPGALSPSTGLLRNCNSTCLNNKPFKQDLEQSLGREIRMSNDANCFALSEATDGAGKAEKIVFGVIVGTGCGAGVIVNGQVVDGPNAIGGEWGHNPLPWPQDGELNSTHCWCGKNGCIETFISGTGLAADYLRVVGEELRSQEIVDAANGGSAYAEQVLVRYERRMAKSLAHIINILDPDTIVLGGGMSNVERLYKNVPLIWRDYVFSDTVLTKLVPPKHGDSSGVRGAAWLWND